MGRKVQQILSTGLLLCLLLAACNKDRKGPQPTNPGEAPPTGGPGERNLYIACEGSFGNGNASLYMQNLETQVLYENVFLNVNGKSVGDVFQSMERIGDSIYMCINNSDKILVIDANTRKHTGTINIPKPRYILPVNPEKAYVSTMYSNKVYIINPKTLSISGTIEMPAQNPEGMLIQGSRAYICTWDVNCNKVYIVSIVTDQVTDSYTIGGYAPKNVLADKNGAIWVLAGNVQKQKPATLTQLVPGSSDIIQTLQFDVLQDPIKPVMNNTGDVLYFIGVDYNGYTGYNGIFKMSTTAGSLPATPLIPAKKFQYYWGLGIDPVTDEIYVGDPKGFVQQGSVTVYTPAGEQRRVFNVGVGPGYFYFDE